MRFGYLLSHAFCIDIISTQTNGTNGTGPSPSLCDSCDFLPSVQMEIELLAQASLHHTALPTKGDDWCLHKVLVHYRSHWCALTSSLTTATIRYYKYSISTKYIKIAWRYVKWLPSLTALDEARPVRTVTYFVNVPPSFCGKTLDMMAFPSKACIWKRHFFERGRRWAQSIDDKDTLATLLWIACVQRCPKAACKKSLLKMWSWRDPWK